LSTYYPLSTAPAPYDIVWCRFPFVENPDFPAPESHPGLVRQAFADQEGNPWVEIVYGTSVDPNRSGNQYFTVSKVSEMDACNLKYATRFCFDRSVQLPWSTEYFEPLKGASTPILGHLTDYGIRLLQTQIGYYQQSIQNKAERDLKVVDES